MIMRHCPSLVTTTDALIRVFLSTSQATSPTILRILPISSSHPPRCLSLFNPHQHRYASNRRAGGNIVRTYGPNGVTIDGSVGAVNPKSLVRPNRPPRDEQIRAMKVHVVNPETNRLAGPHMLIDVLNERGKDEKGKYTQYIQEVAPPDEGADPPRYYPIVKIFDKKLEREKETEKRKAGKEKKQQTKQLEVSWTIGEGDLGHRLGRLKEFLEKGWKVEMLFGVKRKGWNQRREATLEEVTKVLDKIREAVKEIEGAKEWREMQGKAGGEAVLYFEGKVKK